MAYEIDLHTNQHGEPDMDFYMQEAKTQRHEALVAACKVLIISLKSPAKTLKLNFKRQSSFGTLLGY